MDQVIFRRFEHINKLRMCDVIKWLLMSCLTLLSMEGHAQNDFCSARNTAYKDGEKLTFRVYYNMSFVWINAGNAHFNIRQDEVNGKKVFHIAADGKTAKSYEWVYKVRDKYDTYIDKATMLPVRFVRHVNEGGFKINQDVTLDQAIGKATSNGKEYDIPKCTQDVLSAIYYARNIDFSKYKPGDKIPFSMFLDDKVYSLYIKYVRREQVTTKMGTYNAIRIVPLLIEGTIFKGGEKMTVWVTDDDNHLPLRVESPILVGSIKVDLISYENLRNQFAGAIAAGE